MRFRFLLFFCVLVLISLVPPSCSAAANLTIDGRFFSFSSQNDSYAQILDTFHQQAGVEYDVPTELRNQRLPLVEIKGLTLKSALVKILEGSHYDYILIASPEDPEKVRKLIVTGKSVQTTSSMGQGAPTTTAMVPHRVNRQMAEDPFGGGVEIGIDDATNNDPMIVAPVPENSPVQGQGAPQPTPAGGVPPQSQPIQTQQLQSAPGLQQQSIGQPLPPMTPQQVMPGLNQQQQQQGNNPSTRRTPF